tara:strand:+ start:4442 stop:4567 length:126 start_codon:yes stop_codon:yes gene_type:complete
MDKKLTPNQQFEKDKFFKRVTRVIRHKEELCEKKTIVNKKL